jgi:hypothetical protein
MQLRGPSFPPFKPPVWPKAAMFASFPRLGRPAQKLGESLPAYTCDGNRHADHVWTMTEIAELLD